MKNSVDDFTGRYQAALKRYVAERGEDALREAYDVGRLAFERHISLLEVLQTHEKALHDLMDGASTPEDCERLFAVAEKVLAENLAAFEMAQRGYLDAITALRRQTEELRRSNEDLETFASVASHDLQEPLRKINTFSEMLKEQLGPSLDPRGLDYLTRMQKATERMSRRIQDLLRYARVGAGAAPPRPLALGPIVRDVLDDLDAPIREARAEVQVEPLPTVVADPVLMAQLFQNLISNTLKFKDKERPICVAIRSVGERGNFERISVADNGIGFEQKYAERIFKPFQRLHGSSEYPGTGMGLAISRKIAERFGGAIEAHGEPGIGATFIVAIPRGKPKT